MGLTATKYKQTEVGLIPEDWNVRSLGDVGEVKMCKRIFSYQTKDNGDIPFYKIGTFGKEPDAFISRELFNEYRNKYSFPTVGSVLISAAGTIGRLVVFDGTDSYFQDSNIIWIENNNQVISNEYLRHSFPKVRFQTEGGTIKRLYNNILKSGLFPCPPDKEEQKAIAQVLSDTDSLIQALEKKIAKKKLIKKGMMQKLLTPKEDWEVKTLGDFLDYEQPTNYVVESTEYNENYDIPVLTAGKSFILGYTNEKDGIFENYPVIIFDDFTTATKFVDFPFKVKSSALKILKPKNKDVILGFIFEIMQQIDFPLGDHKRHWIGEFQPLEIMVPKSKSEQIYITQILTDMDKEIAQLEEKLSKYQLAKQGMMQQLLSGKTRLV